MSQTSPPARGLARRLYGDRGWQYQLVRYVSIGGFVACIDVGSFALLLRAGWPVLVAATGSYGLGVATHFTLNKYANFRAHERPVAHQAVTYAVVAFACWLTTLAFIKIALVLGAAPLLAKIIALVANVPIGFWAHRHLTFGHGILAALRGLFQRRGAG